MPVAFPLRFLFAAVVFAGTLCRAADAPEFEKLVKPFLSEHCTRCHDAKKQKGDLRIDTLSRDLSSPQALMHWADIMDRISAGEMPPEDEKRPDADAAARVVEWIASQASEAENARQSTAERLTFHKLTREEYANSIRDLLGITYDARDPSGLPEDPDWHGFERIGSVLTLSPAHVEKYMAAAESILTEALALGGPAKKSEVVRWTASGKRVNGNLEKELATKGLVEKVRMDIVPNNGALDAYDLKVPTTGDYAVRVKLSGLRAVGGRAARLRIYATDLGLTFF